MDKIISAKGFLRSQFKSAADGGIIKMHELARLFGANRNGRLSERDLERLIELCSQAQAIKHASFEHLSRAVNKNMRLVLSTSPADARDYVGLSKLKDGSYGLVLEKAAYYANHTNLSAGMNNHARSIGGYRSEYLPPVNEPHDFYTSSRPIHFALLSDAVATGYNIVYLPDRLTKNSIEVSGRVKGKGYEIQAVIVYAPLQCKIDKARQEFDENRYPQYSSKKKLVASIEEEHEKMRRRIPQHLKYADSIEIFWRESDEAELVPVLGHTGEDWIHVNRRLAEKFLSESGFDLEQLTPGQHHGIDNEHYQDHPVTPSV